MRRGKGIGATRVQIRSGKVYHSAKIRDHESHNSQGSLGYLQGVDGFKSSYPRIDRCDTTQPSK